MNSTTLLFIVLAVVAVVVIVAGAVLAVQRGRSRALQRQFGPEYDQALSELGDRCKAESELAARQKRVAGFDLQPLTADARQRFAAAWQAAQTRFVDEPAQAIVDADALVTQVMEARGYPMGDFDQRAADLSVDHADVVTHYRAARQMAQENAAGQASTETLRQGMIHYRALFEDLLGAPRGSEQPHQKELST